MEISRSLLASGLSEPEQRVFGKIIDRGVHIQTAMRKRTVEDIHRFGVVLKEVSDFLEERKIRCFQAICREYFGISPQTAGRYMRSAEFLQLHSTLECLFEITAIYKVTEDSCPEPARKAILHLAERGTLITAEKAELEIKRHSQPATGGLPSDYSPYGKPDRKRKAKKTEAAPPEQEQESSDYRDSTQTVSQTETRVAVSSRVINAESRRIDTPSIADVVSSISSTERIVNAYAESEDGREVAIDRTHRAFKDLKSAVIGGKPHVMARDIAIPEEIDTPEVRQELDRWLIFKRRKGQSYKDVTSLKAQMKRWGTRGAAAFIASVEYSIAQDYDGLHEEKIPANFKRTTAAPKGAMSDGYFSNQQDPAA